MSSGIWGLELVVSYRLDQHFLSRPWKCAASVRLQYSTSTHRWYKGDLDECHIVLDPNSGIAAMSLHDDVLCIYYQGRWQDPFVKDPLNNYLKIDPKTDFIRRVYQLPALRRSSTRLFQQPMPSLLLRQALVHNTHSHPHRFSQYHPRWFEQDLPIAKAVKGSSIAIIRRPSTTNQGSCIFYQDPELHCEGATPCTLRICLDRRSTRPLSRQDPAIRN